MSFFILHSQTTARVAIRPPFLASNAVRFGTRLTFIASRPRQKWQAHRGGAASVQSWMACVLGHLRRGLRSTFEKVSGAPSGSVGQD
eukprot:8510361-Pyramimonas_sp.AAC.1